MPWRAQLDAPRNLVEVAYSEDVSAADIRESALAVIGLMKQADTGLVLADITTATRLELSTSEVVGLPELFRRLGLDRPFREAMIAPLDSSVRDQAEFYETVCVNRGIPVRVFRDRDSAVQWLVGP